MRGQRMQKRQCRRCGDPYKRRVRAADSWKTRRTPDGIQAKARSRSCRQGNAVRHAPRQIGAYYEVKCDIAMTTRTRQGGHRLRVARTTRFEALAASPETQALAIAERSQRRIATCSCS